MKDDGNIFSEHADLGTLIQKAICRRFEKHGEDFAPLVVKFGPHKIALLFWPSLIAPIVGIESKSEIPLLVLQYLVRHFRLCPECRDTIRQRIKKTTTDHCLIKTIVSQFAGGK